MISEGKQRIWQAKLAAYLHDPASKALILMRGINHEEGSVRKLKNEIFSELPDLKALETLVKKADHWASAADRPQLPMNLKTRVIFVNRPELIHPLTGDRINFDTLAGENSMNPQAVEALNFTHFRELIIRDTDKGDIDWERTFLSFWRLGKEYPAQDLGVLWENLPADTRSPDHSIWEHLNLTSAFAGAMAGSETGNIALFLMSFGPVQGFIAQARSVSDLWAGSHLLSYITWQAIKVICELLGPDSIIFPDIHGIPIVDHWLAHEKKIPQIPLDKGASDSNSIFSAALPNRFVAVIPEGMEEEITQKIRDKLHGWISETSSLVLYELELLGAYAKVQMNRHLESFPEIYWNIVPWNLAGNDKLNDAQLKSSLEIMGSQSDYLDESLATFLEKPLFIEETPFFTPNPGAAYPGLYELTERVHASAKSCRAFGQAREKGYRCSICGEREWLTNDAKQLELPPGQRNKKETPWILFSQKNRGVKEGEHLCGLCGLKRLWPRLFVRQISDVPLDGKHINRYIVSTHTLSLALSIWNNIQAEPDDKQRKAKKALEEKTKHLDRVALPKKLYSNLKRNEEDLDFYGKLPSLIDYSESEASVNERRIIEQNLKALFKRTPEKYYAFILMDGDEMGKWIAGKKKHLRLRDRFHSDILEELESLPGLIDFLNASRPNSPAWHQSISVALNNFAVKIARLLVEEIFMGKLIYAGGDDLLAMVALHDLPSLMLALRCGYSGHLPSNGHDIWNWLTNNTMPKHIRVKFSKGFGLIDKNKKRQLLRLMGPEATASIGAVVAHHKAPLTKILNELRAAEKRAKEEGNRDAFSITLMKRSGGTTHFTAKWKLDGQSVFESNMGIVLQARKIFADSKVSRRAAYILCDVLRDVPPTEDALSSVICFQLVKQGTPRDDAYRLTQVLVQRALNESSASAVGATEKEWQSPNLWLRNFFIMAEFLAREGRVLNMDKEAQE